MNNKHFLTILSSCLLLLCSNIVAANEADMLGQVGWHEHKACSNPCPKHVDHLVTNASEFVDALHNAHAGETIGIDGIVDYSEEFDLTTNNITITCASPGSGIHFTDSDAYLGMRAHNLTMSNLKINADITPIAVYAQNADYFVFQNNEVKCGITLCVYIVSSDNVLVDNNLLIANDAGTGSGLHMQSGIHGALVTNNTITTVANSPTTVWGGIRISTNGPATNNIIKNNIITGPWQNGISVSSSSMRNFSHNVIKYNQINGALLNGILLDFSEIHTNFIFKNRINGGENGILLAVDDGLGCGNKIINNDIHNTMYNRVLFGPLSGNNLYIGNTQATTDNGHYDCNGDSLVDRNTIKEAM